MLNVLLISNGIEKDVDKMKEVIKNLGDDFFIKSDIIVVDRKEISSIDFEYDFAVTLDPHISAEKKTIDATNIILDRAGEKAEKDIQNQLLKAKATHKRVLESKRK